jgi:hypothetical protein
MAGSRGRGSRHRCPEHFGGGPGQNGPTVPQVSPLEKIVAQWLLRSVAGFGWEAAFALLGGTAEAAVFTRAPLKCIFDTPFASLGDGY